MKMANECTQKKVKPDSIEEYQQQRKLPFLIFAYYY